MEASPGQGSVPAREEGLVDFLGLTLVYAVIIAYAEWLIIGRVNYITPVISLIATAGLTRFLRNGSKLRAPDRTFLLIAGFYALVLATVLYAYPLFPVVNSQDFFVHLSNALSFADGLVSHSSLPANPALSMLLSTWLSADTGAALFLTRVFVCSMLLVCMAPVYAIGYRVGKREGAIVASLMYVLTTPFVVCTLLTTGLYPNLLGVVVCFFAFLWLAEVLHKPTVLKCSRLVAAGFVLVLAHSTDVLFVAAIIFTYPYLRLVEGWRVSSKPFLSLAMGAAAAFVVAPSLLYRLPAAAEGNALVFQVRTAVGAFLSFSPFLQSVYLIEGWLFLSLVLLSLLTCLYLVRRKNLGLLAAALFWFLLSWVASLVSSRIDAWRFAILSTAPFAMLCVPLFTIVAKPVYLATKKAIPQRIQPAYAYEAALVVIVTLLLLGASNPLIYLNEGAGTNAEQQSLYDAIIWLGRGLPANSTIVNVGAWQMDFARPLTHLNVTGPYSYGPDQVRLHFNNLNNLYVVVWNRLYNVSETSGGYFVDKYKASPYFSVVWSNQEITVFILKT